MTNAKSPFHGLTISFLLKGCFQQKQQHSQKKNGNGKYPKIFINSENLRGRRPVTGRYARKDPQTIMDINCINAHAMRNKKGRCCDLVFGR